jgi:lathosterol oxidase
LFTTGQWVILTVVALLGHAMGLFWFVAQRRNAALCRKTIYDMPFPPGQIRRELLNSVHTPIHAVMLGTFLLLGFFRNTTWTSFWLSLLATTLWAEIWHYFSHRLFHVKALHWIHAEHHKSHLNSPFTAISFSFSEKFLFNLGMIGFMALVDRVTSVNFFGVAGWYVGYLIINSYSHANFEIKSEHFLKLAGRFLATTTYHSLHHSRYINNYGLGTRFLDRAFGTEWPDYEDLYAQISEDRVPLRRLSEKAAPRAAA